MAMNMGQQAPMYMGNRGGGPDPEEAQMGCGCSAIGGTRVLCVIELVLLTLQFTELVIIQATAGSQFTVQFCVGLFMVVAWAGVVLACLWGLSANSEGALIPHVVMSILTIFTIFIVEILFLVMVASGGQAVAFMVGAEGNENNIDRVEAYVMVMGIVSMVVYAAVFIMQCWAVCIVYSAFKYIRERNDMGGSYGPGPGAIHYAAPKQGPY